MELGEYLDAFFNRKLLKKKKLFTGRDEKGAEHLENLLSALNLSKSRNVQEILYVSVFS
jgi:hypothetical protein